MARLFLLDGTALAYRSHYALMETGLRAADGTPTGATYGFTTTLRAILERESPDLVAVAFDASGPTFRHERFADYKATRQKAPEEMVAQLGTIGEIARAYGIAVFEIPGYEADDVIGTLATQAVHAGHDVFIVTADKDFMQLVGPRLSLYNVFKQGKDYVVEGVDAVREKFGTDPAHVVDVLAIMGDSSDNVPGVKGIGEKGAKKLIEEFGSVPVMLERIDEVKGKTKEKIESARELLLLSLDLVRIATDVPLERGLESIGPAQPDAPKLRELFARLDFKSLVSQVAPAAPVDEQRDYRIVRTRAELDALVRELRGARAFALRVHAHGTLALRAELQGLAFATAERSARYVPLDEAGGDAALRALAPVLTDAAHERVGHDTKFDTLVLARRGVELPPATFDTMVASFTVAGAGRRHALDSLALHYFGIRKTTAREKSTAGQRQTTMDELDPDAVGELACEDADVAWRLRGVLAEELEQCAATKLFHELEMPLVPVLARMERRGIRLDPTLLDGIAAGIEGEMEQAAKDVQRIAGREFNVNSTKVLGEVLFEELRIQDAAGVKKPRRTKTGWATDAQTLEEKYGDVEIVQRLLAYRELSKLKSTYLDALPRCVDERTCRIHCSFSQIAAATGRLASSDPNLQNIPVRTERGREIRKAFLAPEPDEHGEWVLLAADYSQIELRVMAHLSGDAKMHATFASGHDVHAATAAEIFGVRPEDVTRGQRSQAKVINFGLLYGMGPQRVARETGMTLPEARDFIERYFAAFPTVRDWIEATKRKARELGYVETLLGRRRATPDVDSANHRVRALAENAAVNTPVQGSAADIIKRAMIDVDAALRAGGFAAGMLIQVHDELLFEVPQKELDEVRPLVVRCMERAVELDVPLRVDYGIGKSWLEAH